MSDIVISINDLSKKYYLYRKPMYRILETFNPFGRALHTSFAALSHVNLQVERGESIGIIGRNGSGKSTLLQMICGNLQPTGGNVEVKGRISALLELGAGFNPEFTGRDNVYLSTAILGLSKRETDARFGQITDFADIGDFIDRPVKTYSSGMYIRLAFATAVCVDPEILIIDEALAVGDIFFQQKCMEHMKKMMQGCTILLVSHDMHAITNMCDRVLVLNEGEVVYEGEPPAGVAKYTKIVHSEKRGRQAKDETPGREALPTEVIAAARQLVADFDEWFIVAPEDRGGLGEVTILRASVTRDGLPVNAVQQGDKIDLRLLVYAKADKNDMIFGYTMKDRVGNAIFGQNSLCLETTPLSLKQGYSVVEYSFLWPEVYPDEYTLTLGIGEGTHPLIHTVQCWAHNIVALAAVTSGVAVHGIFNNNLEQIAVVPVGAASSPQ
ncbi:teichoic acids export ATP-binding protein TagH [bacterium BMS3Bbin14]|nr:teichoic acids export ATP-binding protein TagH [bacterium BMS3Abin13]GBE53110.1 teichoic acids export ATP-binding protein TagH [bacterium BMS3Bbin14]HDO30345.1 ATP-binding cassette domain-containing protein [Desulfobacteraceae bacterium]